jgi:transposase InsO family protein
LCKQFDIEHRLIPPLYPHTNGIVERLNGRIGDIVNQTRFGSAAELKSTLRNYVTIYNENIHSGRRNIKRPFKRSNNGKRRSRNCGQARI